MIRSTFATGAALLGIALGAGMLRGPRSRIDPLIYGAAGILLAVVLLDIIPESYHQLGVVALIAATVSGFAVFALVSYTLISVCPACGPADIRRHSPNARSIVPLIAAALTLHSFMDGAAIASSSLMASSSGTPIVVAIMLHKVPEGIALFGLLVSTGMLSIRAVAISVLIESTTELGGVAGLLVQHSVGASVIAFVLAHVAGGFLYLCGSTIWPAIRTRPKPQFRSLAYTLCGFTAAAALLLIFKE